MKKGYKKAMAMSMAFAMMGSTMAFAETVENKPVTLPELSESQEVKDIKGFISQSGKVASVTKSDNGSYEVMIDNENGGLRFMVSANTVVVNREDGTFLTADKLTEGMEVSVIYGENSPMGMSMPPFLGQVSAVIANADKGSVSVGYFDQELLNEKDSLLLNISEDTKILNTLGTKQVFTAEDVKGKNAAVFYDITTRSIPAQTNPSFILILEEMPVAEETTQEETAEEVVVATETEAAPETELIPLRDKAQELGYAVKWQGHDKPVLVEKEDKRIEVTVGTTKYVVDNAEATAEAAAHLIDGVLYVSADILK